MINIAVCGSNGKMGQEVVKAINAAEDMTLVAQIDIFNGQFATIKDAKESVKIDVLIDFTQPASIYENALYCLNNGIKVCLKRNENTPRIALSLNFSINKPEKFAGEYVLMHKLLS